ncbi:MAG: hypothetical protein EAX96_21035 [Candidatus Lokiarchaeota archaeon]|nr:hypothetical protein [Candidatus Lokiarchaeota archaeon]
MKQVEELGAGEILLTRMDRKGTKVDYDNYLNKAVTDRIKIPLIASGGFETIKHFSDTFNVGNARSALSARTFHYNEYIFQEFKNYLRK